MGTILKTVDLTKKYDGRIVVDNLNLSIEEGEIFGLLGPNGAGKSTTMNMICGIVKPTLGEVEFRGKDFEKHRKELTRELVGLLEKKNDFARTFSGGMKRRLNIACAIGHHPDLLIFDEPTVGIDPQSRNFILDKIKESNKNGATVIYTSHYMEEVEAICTKIAIMDNGRIIATGTSEELKKMVVEDTSSITLEEVFLTLTGKKLRDH